MAIFFRYCCLAVLLFSAGAWAQPSATKVLLLLAYEPQFPEAGIIIEQVGRALAQQSAQPTQVAVEYMSADLGASPAVYQSIAQLLEARQAQQGRYDLAIVAGNNALRFTLNYGQTILANTPVAFLNVTDSILVKSIPAGAAITGVMSIPPVYDFLAFARFIYPDFKQLYVITDTLTERAERFTQIQQASHSLNIQVQNLSLAQLSWGELGQKLAEIKDQPVLLLSAFRDHQGREKHSAEGIAFMTKHSASPIWHLRQAGISLGLSGGVVTDLNQSADLAVKLALQQLAQPAQAAPPIHWQPPVVTLVDVNQMQRYGLDYTKLPKGTRLINAPSNFWQRHGWFGLSILLLGLATPFLMMAIWWQHKRRTQAEHSLQHHSEIFRHVLDASPNIIFYKDINGRYEFFNQSFMALVQGNPQSKTDYELFPSDSADTFRQEDQAVIDSGTSSITEEWVLDNQQTSRLLETHKVPIYNQQQVLQGVLGFSIDITELRQIEERLKQLEHYTHYDSLTNLPNKNSLFERLNSCLATADEQQMLAVVYLDLDRFKDINDTLGHDTGDDLLKAVAQRLHNNISHHEICARLGSDEFILVLNVQNIVQAQEKCDQLVGLVARPYSLQGHLISIYASAGFCLSPHDAEDGETLVRHADAALHKAKEQGRNRALRYHSDFTDQIQSRLSLEQDLHAAIEKRQFTLLYQPQFQQDGCTLHGVEALIRWQHPTRGLISPVEFIPLAESSGMMVELGAWILRTACQQFLFWREQGLKLNKIAVNVSPVQFTANFASRVAEILSSLNFDPQWLELEVTEGLMMSGTAEVAHQIQALCDQNITLSVDDFGTGYSSLNKLKALPVSVLKIDQSFIRNLAVGNNDYNIVHAIIQMAHSLNLTTVAEGVETAEHERLLQQLGCNLLQGYHYAKPMPAAEIFARYH